ncbi:hypothetical protein L9F63_008336, partial [Diploptera punctata]
ETMDYPKMEDVTEQVALSVAFETCIWEISGSNSGADQPKTDIFLRDNRLEKSHQINEDSL